MRVVIAEDSVLLREGLATLLADAGFDVVARAGDAEDLLLKVRSYEPDVVVTDVRMPPTQTDEGAAAAETIRGEHPEIGVLLLSQSVELEHAARLLSDGRGGFGYLLKDRVLDVDEFVDAIRRVGRGGTAVDPEVVAQLVGRRPADSPIDELTGRERSVLELMAQGRSNQGIGKALFLSPKTVETHIHAIFRKLGLDAGPDDHRRVLAVLAYLAR